MNGGGFIKPHMNTRMYVRAYRESFVTLRSLKEADLNTDPGLKFPLEVNLWGVI